jgi:hypothetical protein
MGWRRGQYQKQSMSIPLGSLCGIGENLTAVITGLVVSALMLRGDERAQRRPSVLHAVIGTV